MNFTLTLSQDLFNKLLAALRQDGNSVGIPIPVPNEGLQVLIEGQGVKANVIYYAASQIATVSIIDKPWWAPVGMIEQKVREALAAVRG